MHTDPEHNEAGPGPVHRGLENTDTCLNCGGNLMGRVEERKNLF